MGKLIEIIGKGITGLPMTPVEQAIYFGATVGAMAVTGAVIGGVVTVVNAITQPAKDMSARATMQRMIHRHAMIDEVLNDARII